MVDMVKVIAAKKEVTYGTDSAPTLAANAALVRNFQTKPVATDRLERNLERGSYGASPSAPSNERMEISYELECAGSGAAGTAPAWMEFLEGCGMAAPVLVATTSAEQKFAAAAALKSSLTQHHWIADQRRKMVGSRGSFTFDMTAGAYPFFGFTFTGLIPTATPFDTNAPAAPDFTRWKDPVEVNTNNTLLTLDGFAVVTRSLTINSNISIAMRNLIGSRYVRRGNHAAGGRLSVEAPALATKDYLARLRSGAVVVLEATHGTVAGNIVEIEAPQTQIIDISERDEDGVLMWDMDLLFTINSGTDDLVFRAT